MATLQVPVRIKRTEVAGRIPQAADLAVGELGVNLTDKKLYSKTTAGDVIAVGDGNTKLFAADGPPVEAGEVINQVYVQLPVGAVAGDPYWDNVAVLLHFDEGDGATTPTDSSSNSYSIGSAVAVGSIADQKFGVGSWFFNGNNSYVDLGNQIFAFGVEDFTLEYWINNTGQNTFLHVMASSIFNGGGGFYSMIDQTAGTLSFNGSTGSNLGGLTSSTVIYNTGWHHVAITRQGSTFRLFVDGVLEDTNESPAADIQAPQSYLGCAINGSNTGPDLATTEFIGYLDELRVTKGVCRYVANFPVATAAHPDQAAVNAVGGLRTWVWDDLNTLWNQYPVLGTLRFADDVQDVDPADGDLLIYDLALGQWTPVGSFEATQSRTFVSVSGTVVIDGTRHFQSLVYSGVSPVAEFAAGVEGVVVEIYNRTTNALTLQASAGVTLTVPSGFNFLRPGGTAEAVFTNGVWSVSGDLFLPGSTQAFDLEDAQDYAAAGSKADGDLLTWDAAQQKFTTAPIDTAAIETYLQGNLQLGELANVNIAAQVDQQYLFFNAAAGEWQAQELPLDSIAEDVQLRTDLGELSDVVITNPADLDQIAYDLTSGTWVNVPGGDITLKANKLAEIKSIPANYTVIAEDSTKVLQVLGLATITLPSNVDAGFQVVVIQTGTDEVNFAASTLLSSGGRTFLRTQYSVATAVHLGSGTWYVFGDLRLEGAVEVPDLLGDLVDVSATPPTTNQVLSWNGSIWAPTTIDTGADLGTSSINELADVDTATAAPTTGQGLVWNGSAWAPGSVSADLATSSIDALGDVDTTTTAPTTGQFLSWNGTTWVPGASPADVSTSNLEDLANVYGGTPPLGGQLNDAFGQRMLSYSPQFSRWDMSGDLFRVQAGNRFEFITGHPENNASMSEIGHFVYTDAKGKQGINFNLSSFLMEPNTELQMGWPASLNQNVRNVIFCNWDNANQWQQMEVRQIGLTDLVELSSGIFSAGDSVFYDGYNWVGGDMFAPGVSVQVSDLGTGTANMLGQQAMYADQASLEADGWTYIASGAVDDASTAFDPGAAWTGLDFLGLGVSSQNWKVADIAVHFDADPNHQLNNYEVPITTWSFDLLCQFFTSDSKLLMAGWKVHNDGVQDWLVVRSEHQLPYGDTTDGIPCEAWFSQDGRIRMMYGTPVDNNPNEPFTFQVGPTSNGIASDGIVIANPTGLTTSGDRAFEFAAVSTPGVLLNRLGDVDTTGATAGDRLTYDGTNWVPEEVYAATLRKTHLAHFDVVGAVPTNDDGPDGLELLWEAGTTSTVVNTQSQFGGASLQVGSTGGGYKILTGTTGSTWTFDTWVRVDATQTGGDFPYIFRSPHYVLGFNAQSLGIFFDTYAGGGFSDEIWTGSNGYTADTWTHIAVQRVGYRYRMWVNGVHIGSITDSNPVDGDSTFNIGNGGGGNYLSGYLDEVRFTHAQQYPDDGSNITVPVAAYS